MNVISYRCASRIFHSFQNGKVIPRRIFHCSAASLGRDLQQEFKGLGNTVYEPYERDERDDNESDYQIPTKKQFKTGMQILKEEFVKWVEERRENILNDPITEFRPREIYRVFSFGRGEDPAKWDTGTDADEGYGYSTCKFTTSRNGCALFTGNLSTQVKQDGKTYRSGFCGIRAPRPKKSFRRKDFYDWSQSTHLVIRCRGDGRTYHINLGASQHFDTSWYNSHCYALFTRGGPYWQVSKIPWSKFILTHKGYIQDKQWEPALDGISSFGITIMDGVDGPFNLEIDYVGIELDLGHEEEHAYEMYSTSYNLGDC